MEYLKQKESISSKPEREKWKAKHDMAKLFINTWADKFNPIWQKTIEGKDFNPEVWLQFVENKEIWDIAYSKLLQLSDETLRLFAYCELPDEGNIVYVKESRAYTYNLMPMQNAGIELKGRGAVEAIEDEGWKKYACQQFLKTVFMYIFSSIYPVEIYIEFQSHESFENEFFQKFRKMM